VHNRIIKSLRRRAVMRKLIVTLAAAGAAVAFATPAAAQFYPQPQQYGYGAPYGHAYGYNNNFGQVRSLQVRINAVERQINRLDRRDRIRDRSADRLRAEANMLERRLRIAAHNGLNPYEANDLNMRIARLEQRVQFSMSRMGRNGWNGYNGYNSNNGWNSNNGYSSYNGYDRDRDGRDDRYEDDRGHDRDDD
jgi:hypothetical protein